MRTSWVLVVVAAAVVARCDALLEPRIGVVEGGAGGAVLAAAVDAALGAGEAGGGAVVSPVEPGETLALPAHVCAQAAEEAVAALGGGGGAGGALSAAAAARAGLPLLVVRPAPASAAAGTLALYPHEQVLAEACVQLCREKGWQRAVLLHEGSAHAVPLLAPDPQPLALAARQLPPDDDDDAQLRNLLLVLKKSNAINFIVWSSAERAVRVLDAAQRVGLLGERHSYIVPSLELHTQSLDHYSHGGANITGMMVFEPGAEGVRTVMSAWRAAYAARLGDALDEAEAARVTVAPPTALLLAYDAATLVRDALQHLELPALGAPADCARGVSAFHADTLLNYLRSEEQWGVSGLVSWDGEGARRAVRLQVAELERGGRLTPVGVWSRGAAVTWRRPPQPARPPPHGSMTNRTFTVLIAPSPPYIMKQESAERLAGNARYEGFCIELIEQLADVLGFNFTFIEQPDGKYGNYNATTGQWDGMVRRLMDDPSVDFALTDLTITAEREKAVDFTTPFMNLGISILFRKPKPPEPELFAFLLPFSRGVWLGLGLAFVGTSLVLYVVGRLCPDEWQNPYPCLEEPAALENQFTLANALWFALGAVLLQGSEIAPVAYGTRAVASAWWVFALVITSSYTANLASLLATKTSTELIHDVKELADNEYGISYGAKRGGSTYTFFEHSQNELYSRMFQHMKEHTMPEENKDGIKKVVEEEGKYAFLMESTTIEYVIERNCNVTKVGDLLDSKGYGIAMRKESPYRQALNLALLNLQERGVLREMKHTWWKEKHGGGACKAGDERESQELSMRNFLGLFLVLAVGCALGVAGSCVDLALMALRHPRDPSLTFRHRFAAELRFVFHFNRSVKPVQGPLSESASSSTRSTVSREGSGGDAGEAETAADERAEEDAGSDGGRVGSASRVRARRRSSMHAASMRLARHARRTSSPVGHT